MRIHDRQLDLTAEEGARLVALGLLDEATEAADALAAGLGEEPLHHFRVAVRRLRGALRTYRPWLGGGVRRRHERRLRKLARSTNEARDAEVQLAWLAPRRGELGGPALLAGHGLAVARFEARLHGGPDAARVAARYARVAAKLRRRLEGYERRAQAAGEERPRFAAALATLVDEQADALASRVEAIRDAGDVEGAHRARIEGKRLRYLLEPLRGYPRADASEVVGRLKQLQDVLGELHDAHVLAAELGAALVDVTAERARLVHAATLAPAGAASIRDRLRESPRPGLLALVRLVRARRDGLFVELERQWRRGGIAALAALSRGVADGLLARAGGQLERERRLLPSAARDAIPRPGPARVRPAARRARRRRSRGRGWGAWT